MYILSHRPLPCQLLIFQLYPEPKLFKDGYKSGPFLRTGLQTLSVSTWQFKRKFRTLCSIFEKSVCLHCWIYCTDLLEAIWMWSTSLNLSSSCALVFGIWPLKALLERSVWVSTSVWMSWGDSMQKLKLHQFKQTSMDSD